MAIKSKRAKKKTNYLVTRSEPKSPISEQYRTIRTNIQFSSFQKEMKSIMVTSPDSSEGKSTTAANLAIVFAQQGKKVLLVDADLRKPTIHYMFNVPNTVGLTNMLVNQVDLAQVIFSTEDRYLHILPSGPIPPNPSELLASDAMQSAIEEMQKKYDVVLLDTPPVLKVSDAQIAANLCEGSVLVLSSGKTEIQQAIKAKELLNSANSHFLGVVLNNKKMKMNKITQY